MAQSGNRPPRRGQSAKTGNSPPASGTGRPQRAAENGHEAAAERARERLAQRNLSGQKQQSAAQRARTAPAAKPRSKAEAAAAQRARTAGPGSRGRGSRRGSGRSNATIAAVVGTALVLVVVLIIVLVSVTGNKPAKAVGFGTKPAPASVVSAVTKVPPAAFTAAGSAVTASGPYPEAITPLKKQPPLTSDGKPLIIYVGSNWCPYCAASRWPLTVALGRFGSFKNLKITESGTATGEPYPKTNTLSYYRSTYSSPYISFLPVEQCSDYVAPSSDTSTAVQDCNGYEPLESLTGLAKKSFLKYDFAPTQSSANAGGIPYIDFANKWVEDGAFMDPTALGGYSWGQIGVSLSNPVASPGQPILVGANYYTALICNATKGKPGSVCNMPVVKQAAAAMKL